MSLRPPSGFDHGALTLGVALLLSCFSTPCLADPRIVAGVYRNLQYGFSVEVPPGYDTCHHEPMAPNHGIGIYLDPTSSSSDDQCSAGTRPLLSLYADWNAIELPSTEALRDWRCDRSAGKSMDAPHGLALGAFQSLSCRIDQADGFIVIMVVAQAYRSPSSLEPRINYSAYLRSRPERLEADISLLRSVLAGTRFFDPY